MQTLEKLGTPLARIYRGSGRLTGDVVSEEKPANDLDRETNYRWVGEMTQNEFQTQFVEEEHAQCHTEQHPYGNCPDCVEAGWVY